MPQTPPTHGRPSRPLASRAATALTLLSIAAVGAVGLWLATGRTGHAEVPGDAQAAFPRETGIGACLAIAHPPTTRTEDLATPLLAEATARDHLFPSADVSVATAEGPEGATLVAVWPGPAPSDVDTRRGAMDAARPCRHEERGWAFTVTGDLLADGADRLMERADFGPDWTGRIEVSLVPETAQVRTTLHFSGPLGISGSCWLDETIEVDDRGWPAVTTASGDDAGLAGLVACRRFERELAEGGAGAQAIALLPPGLGSADGGVLLQATDAEVTDDLVTIRGVVG